MSYGTAIHILLNINEYTEQEILEAVQKILSMSTINSTPKQALLNGLWWFFDNSAVEEGGGTEKGGRTMASDLIYREDAKDFVRHAYHKGLNPMEYLDEVPAADVIPVEWIESQADFDKWNDLVNRWNEYKEECK